MHTLTLSDLLAMSATPFACEAASPLAAPHCLVVDLRGSRDDLAPLERMTAAVQAFSCPVIALCDAAHPLATAFDATVGDDGEWQSMARNIARAPLAAGVLVQVLRHTEGLALAAALAVESLAYATLQAGPEFRQWREAPRPATAGGTDAGPPVSVEREGSSLSIRLNRPSRRNALSIELRDALVEALQLVVADPSIARVRIDGAGDCFSIGGDLDEFGQLPDAATAHAVRLLRSPAQVLARCAHRVEFHLHSACIGAGVELPAFGRRVVASPDAFFQLPELRFGLIPGAGGCVSIARRIGRQRTAAMALSMKRIPARTALAWGLVDAVES